MAKDRRRLRTFGTLEDLDAADPDNPEQTAGDRHALSRINAMIHALNPLDRQVMLLWLEDLDPAAISEISGLSANAVGVKIHRIKAALARRFSREAADV